MNVAIVFGIHGSIEGIVKKSGDNVEKVSEILLLRKYAEKFDDVYVFSHDSRSYEKLMPKNCMHIRLRNRFFYLTLGWLFLLFYALRHRLDVIRFIGPSALPLLFVTGCLVRSKKIIKYYYLWYNTFTGRINRYIMKHIEKLLLWKIDYAIACNSEVEKFVGRKMMEGVKEGIITEYFDPKKSGTDKYLKNMKGVKLVFVGRLVDIKDPLMLMHGYRKAKEVVKDIKLIVCGDGELMSECKKMADNDVHFLGFVGNIPAVLSSSDIYVITSKYDASPRSLMESMCIGLPTIATKVGGIPEYLTDDCGFLVNPGDVNGLAKSIVKLSKERKLRENMGKNARERALKYFDLNKNLDKELSFISKLK